MATKIPESSSDITVAFNISKTEQKKIADALDARGYDGSDKAEKFYDAMLEEIDKLIPGHQLVELAKTECIGIVLHDVLPDARLQRYQKGKAPDLPPALSEHGQGPNPHPALPVAALPGAVGDKVRAMVLTPLSAEDLAEARRDAGELPYPTHEGKLSVDGKFEISVYQLSNGERVLDAYEVGQFFATFGGI